MGDRVDRRDELVRTLTGLAPAAPAAGSLVEAFLLDVLPAGRGAGASRALEEAGLLDPAALAGATPEEVAVATGIGPGVSHGWARRLVDLAVWLFESGGPEGLERRATDELREELRGQRGIGPQLADSLLLDGLDRPAYPVDRGTYRVLVRHGWIEPEGGYDEARAAAEDLGGGDTGTMRAVRAGLGVVARRWCKPREAKCEECPLGAWLPPRGPSMYDEGT